MFTGKQQNAPSGASLIARMQALGLTYRKTAELLGSDHSYLWLILNEKRTHPGVAYRCRLDRLLSDLEKEVTQSPINSEVPKKGVVRE